MNRFPQTSLGSKFNDYDAYPDDPSLQDDDFFDAGQDTRFGIPEEYSDHTDDIMNSSPSPTERRTATGFPYQRPFLPQSYQQEHYSDDITQYEDADLSQPSNETYMYSLSPPSPPLAQHLYQQPGHSTSDYMLDGHENQYMRRFPIPMQAPVQYFEQRGGTYLGERYEPHPPAMSSNSSRGSNPRNASGIRLRPVSELPDMYRGIFKFGVFNAVQSSCFDSVLASDENLVISAPTGSGKTVLFELSIIRMLMQANSNGASVKCVYMSPTKALCSERYRDWTAKFDPLGIKCCELTGDTVLFGKGSWGDAKNASIIITTGEKWDSLTRNWQDNGHILSQIQLFLVDEVHILNESRGSTLEVVISRMKSRGSAVRFLMVSATVPNIVDIGNWVGSIVQGNKSAKVFEFGEEFRPCKLARHVYGIPRQKGSNDFAFAKILDSRLYPILQEHSVGKPMLIFCSTRKGVFSTAEVLMKEYKSAVESRRKLPWAQPTRIDHVFHDKRLLEFALSGIGAHHAGLSLDDRRGIEDLYLKGVLRVIVSTSTLAVGVNLPAHSVVIKGVWTFQNSASVEYSDLDVMQMLGRAGRPQFDKDGLAIILCETELEAKYKALTHGTTILESCLHQNLSEHLNSEVGLGTITNVTTAKEWLRNSFLFQRIQRNPAHYALNKNDDQTWEERIDDLVMDSIEKLQKTELVTYVANGHNCGDLGATEYGDIMSKFYIRQSTMSLILALPDPSTLREMMEAISCAEELCETKLRVTEKKPLNKLRQHNDIRFQIKKVEKTADKIFLLIQAVLGGISLNDPEFRSADSQPSLEVFGIFKHIGRIARAIVEVGIVRKRGAQIKYGLELVRCFTAKAWEDRPTVLRQIEQIGEKSLKVLAEGGITTLQSLRDQDPLRIDALLNRRPPFGMNVVASVRELPEYTLNILATEINSSGGRDPVEIQLTIECGLATEMTTVKPRKVKNRSSTMTAVLVMTSDLALIDFRRIPTKALKQNKEFEVTASLTKCSQSVVVYITSESVAGLTVSKTFKPKIPPQEYPTMDTRPKTTVETDLDGLELTDFWDNDVDEKGDEIIPIKDLTKSTGKKRVQQKPGSSDESENRTSLLANAKQLPNGAFECNHPCKDKQACHHLCCREGLARPPKKQLTEVLEKPKPTRPRAPPKPSSTKPKKLSNVERQVAGLDSQHARAATQTLPTGRLTLPGDMTSRPLKRPASNFDIELTDLGAGDPLLEPSRSTSDVDDDDLPAPHELLKVDLHTPSSEAAYADSEIDALIRAVPQSSSSPGRHSLPKHRMLVPAKRTSEPSEILPAPKRVRRADSGSDVEITASKLASEEVHASNPQKPTPVPLFLGDSEDESEPTAYHEQRLHDLAYEDFTIDYDLIDVVPTASVVASASEAKTTEIRFSAPSTPKTQRNAVDARATDRSFDRNTFRPLATTNPSLQATKNVAPVEIDDLAELEAFLASGAVEIIG